MCLKPLDVVQMGDIGKTAYTNLFKVDCKTSYSNIHLSLSTAHSIWDPSYLLKEVWEKRKRRPVLIRWTLIKATSGTMFITSLVWPRPGIKPRTSCSWDERSVNRPSLNNKLPTLAWWWCGGHRGSRAARRAWPAYSRPRHVCSSASGFPPSACPGSRPWPPGGKRPTSWHAPGRRRSRKSCLNVANVC